MFGFIWRHQDQNMNIDCMVDNKGKTRLPTIRRLNWWSGIKLAEVGRER